ncbi:MAG: response regulator [Treponema sp.]|nr:response regulator [Treponema sp.]MCL2250729.1 response regulator [Treponema sp.]
MTKPGYMSASSILGTRRKIIYVDDMNYSLISFKKALSKYYEVYLSDSCEKMYKIMEKVIPDLILLDVNMPDIDGYSTIKNLKTDQRYSNIPVIFLTCNSDKDSVVKGLSLGAVDYVIKPFNTEKLVESIENIFNPKTNEEKKPVVKNENNPSILVVDDMTSMLRTIHHSLPDKYKVFLLSKSEVVIDFLQNNKPDIILLDYIMPGISGLELIPKIKALPGYDKTPIIMISSEGTFRNVNDAIALGAADFIVKPFDPKELIYKIEKQIRMMKLQRESEENEFLLN